MHSSDSTQDPQTLINTCLKEHSKFQHSIHTTKLIHLSETYTILNFPEGSRGQQRQTVAVKLVEQRNILQNSQNT